MESKNNSIRSRESSFQSNQTQNQNGGSEKRVNFSRDSVSNSTFGEDGDTLSVDSEVVSPKIPKKFISTWRMACDRTKDRTKELLKRWRTMPEGAELMQETNAAENQEGGEGGGGRGTEHNWSVHVWATWVKRYPSDEENGSEASAAANILTDTQKEKFIHLFSHVLDMDRDDLISQQDFATFAEKLRHFADWSVNCGEYVILQEIQQAFTETFLQLPSKETENGPVDLNKYYLSIEDWIKRWCVLIAGARNLKDFPVWLQYFPKVLFAAINKSGSGIITCEELGAFYSSVMGFSAQQVSQMLPEGYNTMTANGDFPLNYPVYRLCFANFLLGRYPNGPGQYIFGYTGKTVACFPIDYSAMNSSPEDREPYSPHKRSNRHSVVV